MPKRWDTREDGRIYFAGAWRTKEGVNKKIESQKKYKRSDASKKRCIQRKKERWHTDPEFRARESARHKKRYYNNIEKYKIRERKRYLEKSANKDAYNEKQRNDYRRNRDKRLETIYRGRFRRDPTRGIENLIRDFSQGKKEFGEVFERISRASSQLSGELSRLFSGETESEAEPIPSGDAGEVPIGSQRHNENET